jgi:hypothetical protein
MAPNPLDALPRIVRNNARMTKKTMSESLCPSAATSTTINGFHR